jgi:hypothetical protein
MSAPSTDRTAAKIYREAARILEQTPGAVCGCCWAIKMAIHNITPKAESGYDSPLHERAEKLFDWYGENRFGFYEIKANRNARILAMCFIAAMVEAGDA